MAVKLTDFGIGQVVSEEYFSGVTRAGFTQTLLGSASSQTGTQLYMAPEVIAGKLATIRSDIYSLGVVLYQLLVGDFARPLATDWAKDVHDPLLREDLERCFAGNPADRFANAGLLATNLRSIDKRRAEKAAIERATRRKRIVRQTALVTAILLMIGAPIFWGTRWVRESRRQLAQTYVEKGMQFADQGDYMSALPWLAEALDLDRGDPEREEAHRLRLSEALRRCPKLTKLVNVEYRSLTPEHFRGDLGGDVSATDFLSFDPDSQRMVVAEINEKSLYKGRKFQTWDLNSGKPLFEPLSISNSLLAFPQAKSLRVIVREADTINEGNLTAVSVWDLKSRQQISRISLQVGQVTWAHLNEAGTQILTQGKNLAQVWDVATGKPMFSPIEFGNTLDYAVFCQHDQRIVTATTNGVVQVWDVTMSQALTPPLTSPGWLFAFNFDAAGHQILTVSLDKIDKILAMRTRALLVARVWELANPSPITRFLEEKGAVPEIAVSRDGRRIVAVNAHGTARIWDVTMGKAVSPPFGDRVWSASFSPDGRRVVTAGGDNTVRIWDANSGQSNSPPLAHSNTIVYASFSPDGQRVLTRGSDDVVQLWDAASGRTLTAPLRQAGLRHALFSDDGRQILTVGGEIKRWNATTGQPLTQGRVSKIIALAKGVTGALHEYFSTGRNPGGYRNPSLEIKHDATDISFTQNGDRFVVADSRRACIRETASGVLLTPMVPTHADALTRALFSQDGGRIATASKDKTAQVWDAKSGLTISPQIRHEDIVTDVAFSPDGRCVLTASQDKTARIWDASTGQPVGPVLRHSNSVNRALFTPDGRHVITLTGSTYRSAGAEGASGRAELPLRQATASTNSSAGGEVRIWEVPRLNFAAEDLVFLARLTCGKRIEKKKGPVPVDWKDLKQFSSLKAKYPKYFETSSEEVRAWHLKELQDCEKEGNWEAAIFHLDRLIELHPEDGSLRQRRERAQNERR